VGRFLFTAMCYNYETMIRTGIRRSIHQKGREETLASLSEEEKRIWFGERNTFETLNTDDEAKSQSTFPGAEVQVIPIDTRQREYYFFGFLPNWATSFNDQRKNFNARSDSIRIKPTWKKAWKNKQRCLVCASGFYEDDKSNKKRYFFSVKDRAEIYFAGIYNHWKDPATGQIAKTFAIITTEPNELVGSIHPRMPVILDKEGGVTWLKPQASEEAVFDLLQPFPAELMEMNEAPKPPRKKKGGPELNLDF